ncbi:MAG: LrgB family protein [Methanolobus sp.]|nr:LrgB family protein [Methanolobus sp.]
MSELMSSLASSLIVSPLFGIGISLLTFYAGGLLYKKTGSPFMNPLVLSMIMIIALLLGLHISFDDYNQGGQFISFFLGPATVILAVPLYKKISLLKKNAIPILAGISIGSAAGIVSIIVMCRMFGLDELVSVSMIPKSVTTPIGIEISSQLGGLPSITIAAIVFTGIAGVLLGPMVCKLFRIDNEVAVGVAIGTSSHALGTTKAVEIGETEGAMSGLAIGIAGLVTVFLAPILAKLLM